MTSAETLKKIERKLSIIYSHPAVRTVWLVDSDDLDTESLACVSIIVNDTRPGCEKDIKEIESHLETLKTSRKPRFMFNIYRLSEYWQRLVSGDPKLYSEMRMSIILYDPAGFFAPIKVLLLEGRIPCTRESAYNMLISAPEKIMRVHNDLKLDILTKLYNIVIDAGQAPLVLKGIDPPVPRKIADALETHFPRKLIAQKDIDIVRNIVTYYKEVEHGNIKSVTSDNIHVFFEAAEMFIKNMEHAMQKISESSNPQN